MRIDEPPAAARGVRPAGARSSEPWRPRLLSPFRRPGLEANELNRNQGSQASRSRRSSRRSIADIELRSASSTASFFGGVQGESRDA